MYSLIFFIFLRRRIIHNYRIIINIMVNFVDYILLQNPTNMCYAVRVYIIFPFVCSVMRSFTRTYLLFDNNNIYYVSGYVGIL